MLKNLPKYKLPVHFSLVVIILTPVLSIPAVSYFDQKKIIVSFFLIASSFVFIVFFFKKSICNFDFYIKLFFLAIVFLLVLSSILAPLSIWAFLQVGWYLLLFQFLFIAVLNYTKWSKTYITALVWGIILLCVLYVLRVYADYFTGLIRDNWTTWPQQRRIQIFYKGVNILPSGFLGFTHVRFFNHLQTWSIPLLSFGYLYFKDKLIPGLRYLMLFFIASWWMLIFAADARGTMLASFLSLLLVWFLFRIKSHDFVKIFLSTAAGGLALYIALFLLPDSGGREILTRFGDSGRLKVWAFALQQIWAHPWVGLGPMHFSYMGINPPWSTPHNLILQSAAEWGIPAVLIAIVLSAWGYRNFVKQSLKVAEKKDDINLLLRIALICSFTAALIHSMFSGVFNSPLSQLLGFLVIGAMIGEYYCEKGQVIFRKREKLSLSSVFIIILLLINTGFVGYKVASDIPHLNEMQTEFFKKYNTYTLYPRFWNQGMIYK